MAINPESQYPGKIAPSSADYPYGQARNITVPGDGTGTPWEAALVNDLFGFQQALLSEAGIAPSGTPEKATASQYLQALGYLLGRVVSDVTELKTLDPDEVRRVFVTSADGGTFVAATGAAPATYADDGGSACGLTVIPSGGDGSKAFVRAVTGDASVFWFLTPAQIAAVKSYALATDVTTAVQNAWDVCHAANLDVYHPAGGYLTTGLVIPGLVDGISIDDRHKSFRIYGQGYGEAFVTLNTGGTVFKSVTDAPVIQDRLGTASSSNGTTEVDHIRFDGTSTTPVVQLTSFYGQSSFHNNVVYQRGTGDGFVTGWGATVRVYENYSMNSDFASYSLGLSRTGVGFKYNPTADNGLVEFYKNTSRGWLTSYEIGGGTGVPYSASIQKCECSVSYNGILINSNADSCSVRDNYLEGGDGGIGIQNDGDYTQITGNLIFPGFATCIRDTTLPNKGTLIEGNVASIGSTVGGVGIHVVSSAVFGGYNKTVRKNTVIYTLGTAGVKGIKLEGTDARISVLDNAFDPKTAWSGAGTVKIEDLTDTGVFGMQQGVYDSYEFPMLSKGGIALFDQANALTEGDVAANILTLPPSLSYQQMAATVATTVNSFDGGTTTGRLFILHTTNGNTTINDTAQVDLAGGVSFSGPGTITFLLRRTGGLTYAYEIARTVF